MLCIAQNPTIAAFIFIIANLIRIMKKARTLHNTHLTIIDYLDEGMTTRNQKASLKERFRIMAKHYGLIGTVAHHIWFVIRAVIHR